MLTCGERAVRCLLGELVDRVPYGVGLGWSPWGETLERWKREAQLPDLDLGRYFGFDDSFARPDMHSGLFPAFEFRVLSETPDSRVVRDGHGITKRVWRAGESMPQFLAYPVQTEADWYRLKEARLRIDPKSRVHQDWDSFRAHLRATGKAVQVGSFPYGVFGTARDLLGAEALLTGFYDYPDMIRDMMDHMTSLWLALWQEVSEEVQIDHIHIWEDMSGKQGSLISPQMVRDFMMPCYDRIANFARAAGVRLISVDTDGDCQELVPILSEHGVNVMFPFEVQAGNDIRAYRRQYPNLGIMGGLDKRVLTGTRADIDREIEKAWQMTALSRYIPGFDHLIPSDVPWENYRYAAECLREVCYATR